MRIRLFRLRNNRWKELLCFLSVSEIHIKLTRYHAVVEFSPPGGLFPEMLFKILKTAYHINAALTSFQHLSSEIGAQFFRFSGAGEPLPVGRVGYYERISLRNDLSGIG